jgi:hypothetical protein
MGSENEKNDYNNNIIVHPNSFVKCKNVRHAKYLVFDLDETLGSFGDLYILWKGISHLNKMGVITLEDSQYNFNEVLDIYPEFLRCGIMTILEFLFYKKLSGKCGGVFVYTNNQCEPPWVQLIIKYIETRGGLNGLFEPPVCAFKINGVVLETKRSAGDKTYQDFIRCTVLPKNAELCFLDNSFFPRMNVEQVFYIQPKSYFHGLGLEEMLSRLLHSGILNSSEDFTDFWIDWFLSNGFSEASNSIEEHSVFVNVSRKMMQLIQTFFYVSLPKKNKTIKKIHKSKNNITRKNKRDCC